MKNKIVNKNNIVILTIGVIIGVIITIPFFPKRIAKLKDGTEAVASINDKNITADDLYNSMKNEYSLVFLLNLIDKTVLEDLYTLTDSMNTEIDETLEYYFDLYKSYYGYTEEEFLTNNGFSSKDDFREYLVLDYLRNLYYQEYAEEQVTTSKINSYYKNSVFGKINTNFIAVATSADNATDLIEEIITKLNEGSTYEEITEEYKDKITYEELGYQGFNSDLDSEYMTALKKLKDNQYTKEYVTTDYGYTIIFRLDTEEKETLDNVKDDIIKYLAEEYKEADENLYYKALINLRKKYNLEFNDTDLKNKYQQYCKEYK